MWKKIIGCILIISSALFIIVGVSKDFNKTPYCEGLIANYKQNSTSYEYEYIKEVKNPNGSCYNHFTVIKLMSNLIVLGFGVYLSRKKKTTKN
jgi:hypothetical protein